MHVEAFTYIDIKCRHFIMVKHILIKTNMFQRTNLFSKFITEDTKNVTPLVVSITKINKIILEKYGNKDTNKF